MNPQMQNYQRYQQAQGRAPPARRPGESASSPFLLPSPFHNVPRPIGPIRPLRRPRTERRPKVVSDLLHHNVMRLPSAPIPVLVPPYMPQPRQDSYPSIYPELPDPFVHHGRPAYLPSSHVGQPHPNAHYAQQQAAVQAQQAQQRQAIMEHQQAQRRAKKPTDRTLPEGVEDLVIGDVVQQYKDLREAERKLDYTMMRKRMDLQDTSHRTVKRQKTMRLWITNTAENQPWQASALDENAFDFNSGADPTFRVKIEGRLLEDPDDEILLSDDEDDGETKKALEQPKQPVQRFSHFFKSMNVEFDRSRANMMDSSMQVEWKKQPNSGDVDEITFTRRGDENMNISINLVRDEPLERFRLSHALAQTLDLEEADRAEVVMGLWEYVKLFGLQADDEKRSITCDENLRQIFNREQIYFPQIPDMIMAHLHPLPPVKVPYTIRVDQEFHASETPEPTIYDVKVSVDDPLRAKVQSTHVSNPDYLNQLRSIARFDDELAVVVQAIAHSKSKHAFFRGFSKDPNGFTKKWLSSQRRDLEVILGEAARGGGEDGMGIEFSRGGKDGVWGSELAREAVRYMLARSVAQRG